MPTSFRSPYKVLRRDMGYWVNGVYKLSDTEGTIETIMATIQMPKQGDHSLIEAFPYGRRDSRFIKIYTDTRLNPVSQAIEGLRNSYAGDIIFYDDSQYLIFGEGDFTSLSKTRKSNVVHWRYFACEAIEGFEMESAP
jgi:hypothetical protein